jgi:F-type H+-transporting ATPase subunit gamma
MSDTFASLRRKISGAGDLMSIVHTMKAIAATSIGQYENSMQALVEYASCVELSLGLFFRNNGLAVFAAQQQKKTSTNVIGAIVFGSDQGLVGQFNDVIADFAVSSLNALPGETRVWVIGERVNARLIDSGVNVMGLFAVPNSVKVITPLIVQILMEYEVQQKRDEMVELHLFYNSPNSAAGYSQVNQKLLPLDAAWQNNMAQQAWPTKNLPEILGDSASILQALICEYLYVNLFRASAGSLASENRSRLTTMQRAEKKIEELLQILTRSFHRLRKDSIDEELFDVISGFEALSANVK